VINTCNLRQHGRSRHRFARDPANIHRRPAFGHAGHLRLASAREQAPRLDTWNSESNNHTIGINEQLGYHVVTRPTDYQKNL
jgi:hypothetical protein